MTAHEHATETVATLTAKLAPPATVSLATVLGVQVSELVLWATLVYTVLLIGQKILHIWKDIKGKDERSS